MTSDVDAAIEAGLMTFQACGCADGSIAEVMQVQQRLRTAWDARERYRQRGARLARRAEERDARRLKATEVTDSVQPPRPALPTGAAAILARAKAKAAERMKP
ncbi:hypothetical protein [Pseudoxanthomonas sp. PXM01]|uniref:hypothetical protein n=1 Tax=Pseudoxanthomonas sp. PXM01 TaxID=2769295 RepID=UPI00177C5D90|nr:hypothetical protein [Pseudoxanthomonas sp. PXM01]MBD9468410.1 hypothetical protein [Pseudoxanthomonas sp. PXM01]